MANYRVRRMRRKDVDLAIEWAAAEGWNPGLNDAGLFYDTDPQGFFIGELDGDPVGSLSGVTYGAAFGFMGLYIVRPKFRGHNYGLQLWHEVMKYLGARNVGLDGVPAQQSNYMKSGFTLAYRNVRYEGVGDNAGDAAPETVPLTSVDLTQLVARDAQVFPAPRADFVRRWNAQAGAHGRALLRDGQLCGLCGDAAVPARLQDWSPHSL